MKKVNFDKLTKFIKQKNFLIAFGVFCLAMATIGISYASFFTVKTNTTNQSITTGSLSVSFPTGTSSITGSTSMATMSDEAGMEQSTASVIYIQNTGNLDSTYVLNVGYDMANYTGGDTEVLTPPDYIMMAVYEYDSSTTNETLIVGPISMADLAVYSLNATDSRYNRYALLYDTLGSTSTSTNTKTYKIKIWLSDKAVPSVSYTYFYVNAEVVAEVEKAKMFYNLSGTLTDGTNVLSGATISIQNNSYVTTTSSTGTFTIPKLYPGVYNVDITYNSVVYSGNLTVVEGTSESFASMGSTFSGSDIFAVASTYGTTISKILKKNNISIASTYSTVASISSGNLYPTYKFTGAATEDVSGIKIALDTANGTYTMSK